MQLRRRELSTLRRAALGGDQEAARLLLAHSIALGHPRLSVRRYFAARFLGAAGLDAFRPSCVEAARALRPNALLAVARSVARTPEQGAIVHIVASEVLPINGPHMRPNLDGRPRLAGGVRVCGGGVSLVGPIEIGANASFGPGSVVCADRHCVKIGDEFRIGARSIVNAACGTQPVVIGDRVTIGQDARIDGCTIGDNCLIENGVTIIDGSKIEQSVLVEAGSTVIPNSVLQTGWVYSGNPARPIRQLASGECEQRALIAYEAIAASLFEPQSDNTTIAPDLRIERGPSRRPEPATEARSIQPRASIASRGQSCP